jgi:phosphoglycolate phosphatase-like HAD superfamily hydrolase
MRKAIVFDLDNTLIDPLDHPLERNHKLHGGQEVMGYRVYIRPKTRVILQLCRLMPEMSVVLFSAGVHEYVYAVLEEVLMPHLGQDFYFDAIYTQSDLDENSAKRMDWVGEKFQADEVLLVDDSEYQCYVARIDGADAFRIGPFASENPESDWDCELLEVLGHPFFY